MTPRTSPGSVAIVKVGLALLVVALWARSATAAETVGPVVYSAGHRAPIAFFLTYASEGSIKTGDTSGVLEAVDEALADGTGLYRAKLPAGQVASCAKDFTVLDLCVFNDVFPGIDFTGPAAPKTSVSAVERVTARDGYEHLVFNVSVAEVRGRQDVFIRVFSSTTAAAVLASAQAEASAGGAPLEAFELQAVLNKHAVKTVRRLEVANLADPRLYRGLFEELQGLLQSYPVPANVSLTVEDLPQGTLLSLDGIDLGLISESGARINDISPGVHTLRAFADGYVPIDLPVTLAAGQSKQVELTLVSELQGNLVRPAGGAVGGLVLGAGIAALAWSIGANRKQKCWISPGFDPAVAAVDGCPGMWNSVGPRSDEFAIDDVGPSVPLLPLGLAGAVLGGAISGGAVWWGEFEDAPWLWIAAGAVVGAGVVGAAWGLDPPPP